MIETSNRNAQASPNRRQRGVDRGRHSFYVDERGATSFVCLAPIIGDSCVRQWRRRPGQWNSGVRFPVPWGEVLDLCHGLRLPSRSCASLTFPRGSAVDASDICRMLSPLPSATRFVDYGLQERITSYKSDLFAAHAAALRSHLATPPSTCGAEGTLAAFPPEYLRPSRPLPTRAARTARLVSPHPPESRRHL